MGAKLRIKVAEDSDANGITHGSIVLERVSGFAGWWLDGWCGGRG